MDLLLIDTGDRVEGNGLYDASDPEGKYTSEIFKQQDIDVLCSGNHELYKKHTAEEEYFVTVPNFKGRYLSSNVDIYNERRASFVPLAPRFRKFTTPNQGIRISAFGFLFNFKGNYNNTVVQPVEETIQEEWFQEAIRDREVDLFLVVGHVAIRSPEYRAIHAAIRRVRWDTPIQFFGGHSHIRDYAVYDSKSTALESGRYLETIGFMSVGEIYTSGKDGSASVSAAPSFARRYIDNNLLSFHHHTGMNSSTFPTAAGQEVSRYIADARRTLKLDDLIGCAPQDYWLSRAEFPSNQSILSLLQERILPSIVRRVKRSSGGPAQMIINTGTIRFDIFKGPFTADTAYIVSPFTGGFKYLRGVPYEKTKHLMTLLNNQHPVFESLREPEAPQPQPQSASSADTAAQEHMSYQSQHRRHGQEILGQDPSYGVSRGESEFELQPGYTTRDDGGDDGDDTIHLPIEFHSIPDFIDANAFFPARSSSSSSSSSLSSSSSFPVSSDSTVSSDTLTTTAEHADAKHDPDTVDLIFLDFIQPWIILGLTFLGQEYETDDVQVYANGQSFTSMLERWIRENWDLDCA